jgi:hypothetical protein
MSELPVSPLRYNTSIEQIPPDETETIAALSEQFLKISAITFRDGGHALRPVHAKSHGLLEGELTVLPDLPAVLAQGLFGKPATYPAYMRFSTTPGDILPDDVSTPRGLAIKLVGVEGERLPGSENDTTQNFVLVVGKVFGAPDPKAFLNIVKLLVPTTDKAEHAKELLSLALRGAEHVVEAFGGESGALKALGGYPETHILGESFFSQAPLRFGDYVAKLGVFPVSPELTRLTDAPLNVNGKRDGLREAVREFFAASGGTWELRVQLCTDLESMPVENAAKIWPEDKSPYVAVARLSVKPQDSWSDENYKKIDTGMLFSPWHGLAAHRPLGGIMRARRSIYERSAGFRGDRNGCPILEPSGRVAGE